MLTQTQIDSYRRDGYLAVPGLFSPQEVDELAAHFLRMHDDGVVPGYAARLDSPDPLERFPRIMMPHRFDEVSLRWLIDARLNACMTELLGREPYAVQTMYYFKPPGARGQALHQDQFYLRVQPGTCMAAWMAIDRCDPENGCLEVVPGTQDLPVLCIEDADTSVSFTDVTVPVPEEMQVVPVIMEPGDVLFFNGSLVHGSGPNRSRERFRRSLIGHYVVGEAEKVAKWYHPVLRMDGTVVELGESEHGGPCGVWVDQAGQPVVELSEPA